MPPDCAYGRPSRLTLSVCRLSSRPNSLGRRADAEASVAVPAEIQTAIDAGQVEEVRKLLADVKIEGMSKSLQKKLLKNAEIAAKKLAKGGPAAAPAPKQGDAGKAAQKAVGSQQLPAAPPPAVPVPTGGGSGTVGANEAALVEEFLACAAALSLPAEAVAQLQAHKATLATAISPQVAALRNKAYAAGFSVRS